MNQVYIPKEVDGLPDAYGVEISICGNKFQKYEVVSHRIIDKIYDKNNYIGLHPTPFWEFNLKENDELLCVPVSLAVIKFDIRWYEICKLAKEQNANKNSK